jgi:hypothetical protein
VLPELKPANKKYGSEDDRKRKIIYSSKFELVQSALL